MAKETIKVYEWKIKNFSCWCEAVHGECIESPEFFFTLFNKAELYPRGGSGQDDRMSLRFCNVVNYFAGELSFIGGDGSSIFTQRVNVTQKGPRVPLLSLGPKFEAVVAQIRGNHKDQITLRFCLQSLFAVDYEQTMCTTLDVCKISFQTDPKRTEMAGIPYTARNDVRENLAFYSFFQDERIVHIMKPLNRPTNAVLFEIFTYMLRSDGALVMCDENRHVCIDEEIWTFSESLTRKDFDEGKGTALLHCVKIINGLVIQNNNHLNYQKGGILPNDFCFSYLKSSNSPANQSEDSSKVLVKDFKCLYQDQEFTDFQLKCGEVTFPVHKVILSARSPVFKAMLSSDMKEAAFGEVDIVDLEPSTLGLFLTYLYTGGVEDLQCDSALKLYYAADKYQVLSLKKECSDFFEANISIRNVCDILSLANRHSDDQLTAVSHKFISNNYGDVLSSKEWASFMKDKPMLALSTLTRFAQKKYVVGKTGLKGNNQVYFEKTERNRFFWFKPVFFCLGFVVLARFLKN